MFCSTVIPTIGRPTLSRAVHSVLDQTFTADDFEVIVVNDSGQPLLEADWQHSERVRMIHTNRRKLVVARNTGAATARGRYLHFLDDDDWLLPDALESLWTLAQGNECASVLYGGIEFVDSTGGHLGELNLGKSGNCYAQIVGGSWIQVGSALIEAKAFWAAGGFDPLFLPGEETDLWRRLALGGDFANTATTVACVLRGTGWASVSHYDDAVENNRWSRDRALSRPGVFSRLRASAGSSYWQGRVFHAYLAAMRWNLWRRCLFAAASRAMFCMTSLVLAGRHVLSPDFWRAVRDTQVPCTQARILGAQSPQATQDRG